ncbi:unnamed protein product, partial [Ectocarpus sp. 13 AM-2016]
VLSLAAVASANEWGRADSTDSHTFNHDCSSAEVSFSRWQSEKNKEQIRGVQQMGGLTGVSWALLVIHSIWSCALGLDMRKFWRM